MLPSHPLALLSVAVVAAGAARAQGSVRKVDPTNPAAYASIQDAIAAASSGDVLLVSRKPLVPNLTWSQLYQPIRIDKSLSITAETGQDVRCWNVEIVNLSPNDQVVIRGIHFERPTLSVGFGLPTLAVGNCSGRVFLEDCSFQPATPVVVGLGATHPAIDIQGPIAAPRGSVTLVRCTVRGVPGVTNNLGSGQQLPGLGIRANAADLAIWDSRITGGQGPNAQPALRLAAGPGAAAMQFDDGHAFASGSVFTGGSGGVATASPCGAGGNGADAIVLALPVTVVEELGCSQVGGSGGVGCPAGLSGTAEVLGAATMRHFAATPTSIGTTSPHRAGQIATWTHTGVQGGLYAAFLDTAQAFQPTTVIGLLGVRNLIGFGPSQVMYAGVHGAGGLSTLTVPLPPQGPQGVVYLLQTASWSPPALPANSAPSALFLLAAGL